MSEAQLGVGPSSWVARYLDYQVQVRQVCYSSIQLLIFLFNYVASLLAVRLSLGAPLLDDLLDYDSKVQVKERKVSKVKECIVSKVKEHKVGNTTDLTLHLQTLMGQRIHQNPTMAAPCPSMTQSSSKPTFPTMKPMNFDKLDKE